MTVPIQASPEATTLSETASGRRVTRRSCTGGSSTIRGATSARTAEDPPKDGAERHAHGLWILWRDVHADDG